MIRNLIPVIVFIPPTLLPSPQRKFERPFHVISSNGRRYNDIQPANIELSDMSKTICRKEFCLKCLPKWNYMTERPVSNRKQEQKILSWFDAAAVDFIHLESSVYFLVLCCIFSHPLFGHNQWHHYHHQKATRISPTWPTQNVSHKSIEAKHKLSTSILCHSKRQSYCSSLTSLFS